jgi:uncharacterized Tic20 family protein
MAGYLGVPFVSVLAPLAVYAARGRHSPFARAHARQALNAALTLVLYNACALIAGGVLALDAVAAALLIVLPATLFLWLAALAYLMRAAAAAGRGRYYQLPGWLCATILREPGPVRAGRPVPR